MKVVYRRYLSLYFLIGIDKEEVEFMTVVTMESYQAQTLQRCHGRGHW